ncbi:MAG TPA: CRTAC1 family protein [Terriglobales bacterium]|nr:CRTAC1 family protein [Terriglobales bacterium]
MHKSFGLILSLSALLASAQTTTSPRVSHFEDIGPGAGLTVSHISSPEKRYIVESMSGGLGLIDCDNDGKPDIITANGSTVDRYRQNGGDLMITLYHQDSDLHFSDITSKAGLARKGWGMGVAVADYDNDGLPDIYVTGYGGNALYHNLGNCKFEDVTEKAGVAGGGFSAGAAWADYDRDGKVDLFVSRYVHVDMNKLPELGSDEKFCRYHGILVQCGPWGMQGESDLLFHNRGDGTFAEVSRQAGVDDPHHYYGLGATWGDFDNDGWPDLYVANDTGPNFLYRNRHDGTFEEEGLMDGIAVGADGSEQGSMGVTWGDYDRDGRLDMFVTNFVDQSSTLYHNLGDKGFEDVTLQAGLAKPTYSLVAWGTSFFDMDNTGWPDIFLTAGHVYPQADRVPGEAHYALPMLLFRNLHNGKFEDVTSAAGIAAMPLRSRRGAAFGDINNDGCIDILILNADAPPSLLLNHCNKQNHRVTFRLLGVKSNRLAIGARVTVHSRKLAQMDEVRAGGSYISQNDLRLHFGLGDSDTMSEVTVQWPSGQTEVLKNLAADFIYTIVEGRGIQEKSALP